MIKELNKIESLFIKNYGQKITNLTIENECDEYFGFNFQIEKLNFKFRKSKITPKKVGQFVTLWKRNSEKQTEPFNENDNFDFFIFVSEQDEKFGFFIFSKKLLIEKNILSSRLKEGKRGFRLYPTWVKTESKQAEKTQSWQTEYFINLTNNEQNDIEKLKSILN
ncbi:MepB family protein [Faecalibacter sp. LW9]|uniref:MepB family protein n=1 Tax=Faecalibacter sp. LW9 TaxID=3103144 RepID=UPI002AFF6506|nr:MepB family protein [Faecalibacter sp. LW9]